MFLGVFGRAQLAPTGCIQTLGCRCDLWSPAGGAVVSRGLRASTARPYRGERRRWGTGNGECGNDLGPQGAG